MSVTLEHAKGTVGWSILLNIHPEEWADFAQVPLPTVHNHRSMLMKSVPNVAGRGRDVTRQIRLIQDTLIDSTICRDDFLEQVESVIGPCPERVPLSNEEVLLVKGLCRGDSFEDIGATIGSTPEHTANLLVKLQSVFGVESTVDIFLRELQRDPDLWPKQIEKSSLPSEPASIIDVTPPRKKRRTKSYETVTIEKAVETVGVLFAANYPLSDICAITGRTYPTVRAYCDKLLGAFGNRKEGDNVREDSISCILHMLDSEILDRKGFMRTLAQRLKPLEEMPELSPQESAVFQSIAKGRSSEQIFADSSFDFLRYRRLLRTLYEKFNCRDFTDLYLRTMQVFPQ